MARHLPLALLLSLLVTLSSAPAEAPVRTDAAAPAAIAINALGLDLLAAYPHESTLLSPFSIQLALAMSFAGAAGETREQMAKTLHFPASDIPPAFVSLVEQLNAARMRSEAIAAGSKKSGGPSEPITLSIANRLFGQQGYAFRPAFLTFLKQNYEAPLEQLDFQKSAAAATQHINTWVEKQTHDRIRDLLPKPLERDTRLVLVNAIYLKAPWADEFPDANTVPELFHAPSGAIKVPTMSQESTLGYVKADDHAALTIPYTGGDLQFLILLPDKADGLPALEKKLTPALLAASANLPQQKVILHLPKFNLQPPLFELSRTLEKLGMPSAFNIPTGSADFDGIAPRRPDDYLYISDIFHKTFLEIDEKGTEAAAATAVVMMRYSMAPADQTEPLIVRVDRPFLFAVQHRPTGACLFLGRMTNPAR